MTGEQATTQDGQYGREPDPKHATAVYDDYEISGCRRCDDGAGPYVEPCADAEAQFWTLYGHINGRGVEAIGDFESRKAAEEVYSRITGQAFPGSGQSADRLRLMHAAPLLLKALEPYVVEAKDQIDMLHANDSEWTEQIENGFGELLDAYAKASPEPAGTAAATRQIERLLGATFIVDSDTRGIAPDYVAVVCRGMPDRYDYYWSHFDRSQQLRALSRFVEWSGFDHTEIAVVSRKVIDGSPKEQWFAGTDKLVDEWLRSLSGDVAAGSDGLRARDEQKTPFRTLDEIVAARGDENRRQREGGSTVGPRETWPSEIAKANRLKQAGQEQGKSSRNEKANGKDDGHSM